MQDYCDLSYPFKVKASKRFLEELYRCETGRYEDACNARKNDTEREIIDNGYNLVFCDFGDKFKTQLEIRNEQELEETLYVLRTGTIGMHMPTAAVRMESDLQRIIDGKAPVVKHKPTPIDMRLKSLFQKRVERHTNKCIQFLITKDMIRAPKSFKKNFKIETKKIHGCWGGLSRRGYPRITISTRYMEAVGNFDEYKHVADSDFIGSFHSTNNEDHLKAVIAHEVAHAAVCWDWYHYNRGGKRVKAHGIEWQSKYKVLRTHFKLVGMPRPKTPIKIDMV